MKLSKQDKACSRVAGLIAFVEMQREGADKNAEQAKFYKKVKEILKEEGVGYE